MQEEGEEEEEAFRLDGPEPGRRTGRPRRRPANHPGPKHRMYRFSTMDDRAVDPSEALAPIRRRGRGVAALHPGGRGEGPVSGAPAPAQRGAGTSSGSVSRRVSTDPFGSTP